MSAAITPTPADRRRAGNPDCTCPWQWRSLGRLYGVSFGKGWVRMRDDPACPEHGRDSR